MGRSLDAVLAQRYPAELLEVIVIDDHSTDRTAEIVTSYQQRGEVSVEGRPARRSLRLNEHKPINSYKKKEMARAIQAASGELIRSEESRVGKECVSTWRSR